MQALLLVAHFSTYRTRKLRWSVCFLCPWSCGRKTRRLILSAGVQRTRLGARGDSPRRRRKSGSVARHDGVVVGCAAARVHVCMASSPQRVPESVCVVAVIDGRAVASRSVLEYATTELKILDEGMMIEEHRGQPVTMHLFERPVTLARHKTQREYFKPMQVRLGVAQVRQHAPAKASRHCVNISNSFHPQLVLSCS